MWFWNIVSGRRRDRAPDLALADSRILLVEDGFDWRRRNLYALESAGASVDLECSWQSAIELLDRRPDDYDAVVFDLDLSLPGQTEATRALRDRGIRTLIVGVTARSGEEIQRQQKASGCDAVLRLPIERLDFPSPILQSAG